MRKFKIMHKNYFMQSIASLGQDLTAPLTEQAVLSLRRDVTFGVFEPGQKLKLEELQTRYGFSSSPLREALSKLSQEGLVRADERKGFRVADMSRADLQDITRMRLMLDVQALQSAMQVGDAEWEASVVAAHYKLDKLERLLPDGPVALDETWVSTHRAFHLSMLGACESPRLLQWCANLFDQAERYRQFSARHRKTQRRKATEHKRLMETVIKRDIPAACQLLEEHISSTQHNVLTALNI
jgi:DNA-binding GntR family transcriptional regulator